MSASWQTRPIQPVAAPESWERYRGDAREAVLARLVNVPRSAEAGGGGLPTGLVRATVLQTRGEAEALVDIAGKSYLVNTRQPLKEGAQIVLRLLDERQFAATADWRMRGDASRPSPASLVPDDADGQSAAGRQAGGPGQATGTAGSIPTRPVAPVALPALAELRTDTGDAKILLSGSSRLLAALFPQGQVQRTVALPGLLLDPAADTAVLAQQLQAAVEESGLFYESHLQQWREGQRPLQALLREPQAALSPGPPGARPNASATATTPATPPPTAEQTASTGLGAAIAAIPAELRPLVNDQIALLAHQRMALEGQCKDMPFALEIEPDEQREQGAAASDIPLAWRVTVRVDAPHLGRIQLEIALHGTRTQLTVRPDPQNGQGATLRALRQQLAPAAADLQQALDARGLQMSDLSIQAARARP